VRVARDARNGASDRAITSGTTASRRLWPPCRSPQRPGPVGRAPPADVHEWAHAAPRFRASAVCDQESSYAVARTLASAGSSVPRRLGVSWTAWGVRQRL